jgi:NitT/TauT family transport system substrate-binding protein
VPRKQTRRRFINSALLAGASSLLRVSRSAASERGLETKSVRLLQDPGICLAPEYAAEELLRAEGFTDVRYIEVATDADSVAALVRGEVDFAPNYASQFIAAIDGGQPVAMLAGVHVGCFELFANEDIRSIRDLKGKKVGMQGVGLQQHVFVAAMAANVGLDPVKDIDWVLSPTAPPMELFAEGKIDAFIGFPPEPQELRARKVRGHVVVNSSTDRPWSQYFCCMVAGNRDFVRKHPIATKRVLRAILKATDFCVSDPAAAARRMVDGGFTARYDYALQTLNEVPYNKWRQYDPADTLRFYALRLRDAGMLKSAPNKLIAEATDWRFLNELKRELKG